MSRIEDLIAEHCPNGVEFKRLGNIVRIKNGKDHKSLDGGGFPVYGSGGIMRYVNTYAYDKPSVLIPRKGSLGNLFYVDVPFWNVDTIFYTEIDESQVLPKFLYFFLTTVGLGEMNQAGGVPSQTQSVLNELMIPVPPLEVQIEIVEVLDTFTKLEAELEAELEARRRQYKYYREALLTFDDLAGARQMTLSDICLSISAGGDLPANHQKGQTTPTDEFPYPIYSNGSGDNALYGFTNDFRIGSEAVTISARGTIGFHATRAGCFTPIVRLIALVPDTNIITAKYLNYALDMTEISHSGGSIPQLTVPNVKKISLRVPPLEEQERIVAILDKFDALVNDLSIGLPAEIKARRQQYEHYRDRLLTFRERKAA